MPNHTYYRAAARAVGRGWLQRDWQNDRGAVCMLAAVHKAMDLDSPVNRMPLFILREIDSELRRLPSYCPTTGLKFKRLFALGSSRKLTNLIIDWNDSTDRTQKEVMGALNSLARRLERRDPERVHMQGLIDRAIRPKSEHPARHKRLARV